MDKTKKHFKILSLDGGGIFCLSQAMILEELFKKNRGTNSEKVKSGHEILADFDMVVGCSGGSIIAAALAADLSPNTIKNLFLKKDNRTALFNLLPLHHRLIDFLTQHRVGQRFSTEKKFSFLREVLTNKHSFNWGDIKMENISSHLTPILNKINPERSTEIKFIFVTYDFDRDRTRLIRSDPQSDTANLPHSRGHRTLAEACHASSTAPIKFFNKPAVFSDNQGHSRRYWDGAMTGHNNPILIGITEAIASGIKREDIRVLSLGAKTLFRPEENNFFETADDILTRKPSSTRLLSKFTKAASTILASPPDSLLYTSHIILRGQKKNIDDNQSPIIRFSPVIQPLLKINEKNFQWTYPGTSAFNHTNTKTKYKNLFEQLVHLEIASTAQPDVESIHHMTKEYFKDEWNNQSIQPSGFYSLSNPLTAKEIKTLKADGYIKPAVGHHKFSVAMEALNEWCSIL